MCYNKRVFLCKKSFLKGSFGVSKSYGNYFMKKITRLLMVFFAAALIVSTAAVCASASSSQVDCVKMDFTDDSFVYWWVDSNQSNNTHYRFKNFGDFKAMQFLFDPNGGAIGSYHAMVEFKKTLRLSGGYKYMRVTYMTTDTLSSQFTMVNMGPDYSTVTISKNTAVSQGKWVRTNAIELTDDMVTRLNSAKHVNLKFDSTNDSAEYYIKEIAFFKSEDDAYAYYGDAVNLEAGVAKMYFGPGGNAHVRYDLDKCGESEYVAEECAVEIKYADETSFAGFPYIAKVKFNNTGKITEDKKFVRVLYKSNSSDDDATVDFRIKCDATGAEAAFASVKSNTNGAFELSDTVELPAEIVNRLGGLNGVSANHVSLIASTTSQATTDTFLIKALYFFDSEESANNADIYILPEIPTEFTINGNSIEDYQIVISKDAVQSVIKAAGSLQQHIAILTDVFVPIIADDQESVQPYEILVGRSNRELSYSVLDDYDDGEDYAKRYYAGLDGDTLIISGNASISTSAACDVFSDNYLYMNTIYYPENVAITDEFNYAGLDDSLTDGSDYWNAVTNVEKPNVFTEPFAVDRGFFSEENDDDYFTIKNGVLNASTEDFAVAYMQVFEKNATVSADFCYDEADRDAEFGVMHRYTGAGAFVKAGYDFKNSRWYISFREGVDFPEIVRASKNETIESGNTYTISLTVDGDTASLSVNGEEIITKYMADDIYHVTPGKPGVFAKGVTNLTIDNFELVQLSGQGTILRNITHTKLPIDSYTEGGTVVKLNNGELIYTHHSYTGFKSVDGGKTWIELDERWATTGGYPQYIRLNDGVTIAKVAAGDDGIYFYTSSNSTGTKWSNGVKICGLYFEYGDVVYDGNTEGYPKIVASNMNDKLTQGEYVNKLNPGRLYYCQTYGDVEVSFPGDDTPRATFCKFFYSNNGGAKWYEFDTSSWEIEGNEDIYKFGECKIIELADGTPRVYCSWTDYGCIVYADAYQEDGVWKFGPLQKMTDFRCARSSMQIAKDPYAENGTTYYMVWVNAFDYELQTAISTGDPKRASNMPRAALSLAKSTDGENWEYIGDLWRWESSYKYLQAPLNHIVDPFITITEDAVICGTGLSEYLPAADNDNSTHGAQRQHIWTIDKFTLEEFKPFVSDDEGSAGTLDELTKLCRAIANWNGYDIDFYQEYKTSFDLNRDGEIDSIDAIIFERHLAGWDGYDALPFNSNSAS